ncbi:helix-turn-helix protein [Lacticaseibacillus paracasei]|uniref:helix-turn-helix domain-containing protein n=1 Tax=Lacticaseibacillus paracasei TaxID=1597 RepID=UPI000F0B6D84|nr:helix-turn-helix transcriptional regulator [Lacticaseibacillus paracasei]RNE24884.1 helix-turn-helix protein [Lacticaseibacillus paracasei]
MNTYERIKKLAQSHKISISELERTLGLSNGSISKWASSKPNSKYLEKVADYFRVSTDYLLGREKRPTNDPVSYYKIDTTGLSETDVADLKKQLDEYTLFLRDQIKKQSKEHGEL